MTIRIVTDSTCDLPQGIIHADFTNDGNRLVTYETLAQYSYGDYVRTFLLPDTIARSSPHITPAEFARELNLRSLRATLAARREVRIMTNADDWLLQAGDIDWLRASVRSLTHSLSHSFTPLGAHCIDV